MGRIRLLVFLAAALAAGLPAVIAGAQVICISNVSPPPELPVYEQPPIPAPGYMWTPGYWASGPNGYFWVPGTWILPPAVGSLWTPGYWGWRDGIYVWNAGYWGPHIGFYGGINYGFGYAGIGYEGGRWEGGVFAYNRTVNNFGSMSITNVYEKTVVVEPGATRASFNGGSGGTTARPTPEQEAAARDPHVAAIPAQLQHERTASADKSLLASENHGRPAIAATARAGEFTGKGVVATKEEIVRPAAVAPSANVPKMPENKLPAAKNAPTTGGGTPPKQEHREVKSTPPEAKAHPEAKPTPPPPSNTKPAAHAATTAKPSAPPPPHPASAPTAKDKNKKPPA